MLFYYCGFKQGLKIITRWPSYVLMPTFSIYTFAGEKVGNKVYFAVSKIWTIVNIIMTLAGISGGVIYICSTTPAHVWQFGLSLKIPLPLIFVTIIMYLILMYGKRCCGKTFLKRSGLDVNTLEVVDLDKDINEAEGFELQPLCKCRPICQCQTGQRRNSWP